MNWKGQYSGYQYCDRNCNPELVIDLEIVNGLSVYVPFKRLFDVMFSIFGLIVLLIPMIVIGILIKIEDKGPVFYTQTRIGKNRVPFKIYKFRSMCINADQKLEALKDLNERDGPVFKIKNDPRMTNIGKFLRKKCIDELPQLINIIKGDMSLVGPRPALPIEVKQYNSYQMQRLRVKPGLTCYWQVEKKIDTTFNEWVHMDIRYINDIGFITDVKLIARTVYIIATGKSEQ